jgi:twitching motility protein PilT
MRDYETAASVFTVAETGHLVLTTGHANGAAQAVERIIDLFPGPERPLAQARLASFLLAILCQTLVPKASGSGRVAAVEVMLACPAIRNTIREGRIYQLPNAMITQARLGMITLDQVLVRLYKTGVISYESMFAVCNDAEEVTKLVAKG